MGNILTEIFVKWQKAESRAAITKSGATFQTCLELISEAVSGGTYKIHWYMEVDRLGATNFDRSIRVRLGGVIIGQHVFTEDDTSVHAYAGWDIQTFGNRATPVLDIQLQTAGGTPARTARIQNIRLSLELMEQEPGPRGLGQRQPGSGQGRGL